MENVKESNLKKEIFRDLEEIIPEIEITTIKFLKSRKNLIFSISLKNPQTLPKEIIIKKFSTESFNTEYKNLISNFQKGILVPKIFAFKKPYILMEKIDGLNLCDLLNDDLDNSTENSIYLVKKEIFEKLAEWLYNYHEINITSEKESQILVRNKGDLRLKNFLYYEKKIYGIDFENVYEGIPENDIAEVIVSIITTSPGDIFRDKLLKFKLNLIFDFLLRYMKINTKFIISNNEIVKCLYSHLKIVAKRRHVEYNEEILNKKFQILLEKIQNIF